MNDRSQDPSALSRRHWLARAAGASLGMAVGAPALAADPSSLDRIRSRGVITVAVYHDLPPFHVKGSGIDVSLAEALAREMGLKLSLLPFPAGENMADDLRNMVVRGHYLGFGPADLMLHVPVDPQLMQANPGIIAFAPYYRERVMIARRLSKLPKLDSLADLGKTPVAVAGQSLGGWLILGADGGAYAGQTSSRWDDGVAAARAVAEGKFDVAVGHLSELESVLGSDAGIAIDPLPMPRAPKDGWAVGCAVKKDATALAQEVQAAMNRLADSGQLKTLFAAGGLAWRKP